ncbi:MAG: hypothetical protein M3P50_02400, partial [Actinomycetota bacterium]|nr:hypothetical protein [Actinomycetota bacterium]
MFHVLPPSRDSIRPRFGGRSWSTPTGADEPVPADDREARDVLIARADLLGGRLAVDRGEQAVVGGDEQPLVGRVDAQPVDV